MSEYFTIFLILCYTLNIFVVAKGRLERSLKMLVTLSEVLQLAEAKKCAVGSFNTPNLESIMAVIEAAEELNVPVIIMHAEVHEPMMPISVIGPIMIERAKVAKVPVCVHLDHGETLAYLDKALN